MSELYAGGIYIIWPVKFTHEIRGSQRCYIVQHMIRRNAEHLLIQRNPIPTVLSINYVIGFYCIIELLIVRASARL